MDKELYFKIGREIARHKIGTNRMLWMIGGCLLCAQNDCNITSDDYDRLINYYTELLLNYAIELTK